MLAVLTEGISVRLRTLTYGAAVLQPGEAGRGDARGVTDKSDGVANGLHHSLILRVVNAGWDCTMEMLLQGLVQTTLQYASSSIGPSYS